MSVSLYLPYELKNLLNRIGDTPELRETLTALSFANYAAYMMNYGEPIEVELPDFDGAAVFPSYRDDWTPTELASNLLYNCHTNAGRNFAPQADADELMDLARLATHRENAATRAAAAPANVTAIRPAVVVPVTYHSISRAECIAAIKSSLKARSTTPWSVTGGTGTAYGWLRIHVAPRARLNGDMTDAQCSELAALIGLPTVYKSGVQVANSNDHYREYMERAAGTKPSKVAARYWD